MFYDNIFVLIESPANCETIVYLTVLFLRAC